MKSRGLQLCGKIQRSLLGLVIQEARKLPSGHHLVKSTTGCLIGGARFSTKSTNKKEFLHVKTAVCDDEDVQNLWRLETWYYGFSETK